LESNQNETSLENKCQNWLCQSTWIIIISSIIAFIFILTLFSFIYRNKLRKSSRKLCQLFGKNSFKEKKEIVDDLENGRLIIQEDFNYEIHSNDFIRKNLLKQGRFSFVYQGQYQNQQIAIKTYSERNQHGQGKHLFEHEKHIYSLSHMQHTNILK